LDVNSESVRVFFLHKQFRSLVQSVMQEPFCSAVRVGASPDAAALGLHA